METRRRCEKEGADGGVEDGAGASAWAQVSHPPSFITARSGRREQPLNHTSPKGLGSSWGHPGVKGAPAALCRPPPPPPPRAGTGAAAATVATLSWLNAEQQLLAPRWRRASASAVLRGGEAARNGNYWERTPALRGDGWLNTLEVHKAAGTASSARRRDC